MDVAQSAGINLRAARAAAASGSLSPLLAVRQLKVHYPVAGRWPWQQLATLRAVDELNFNLYAGETLGIVGESGCGKSTLARALTGLLRPNSGAISYGGQNLAQLDERKWRALRQDIQMVFQDPLASLNPRMNVGRCIAEPLRSLQPELSSAEIDAQVERMMERTGLPLALRHHYPHELSGGQCQRVGIARALIVRPKILICDEPVSALDVSVQAQIINLLMRIQREEGLAMIFIAHDLAVVRHISQRVLVMYLGRLMEQAACETLFTQPAHPYTKALLASAPQYAGMQPVDERHRILDGEIPSAISPPPGCAFATRCPMADEYCGRSAPHYRKLATGSVVACHYVQ